MKRARIFGALVLAMVSSQALAASASEEWMDEAVAAAEREVSADADTTPAPRRNPWTYASCTDGHANLHHVRCMRPRVATCRRPAPGQCVCYCAG